MFADVAEFDAAAVVLHFENELSALMVGEEELVIKALPSDIVASDLVSGASILGDGTVVLILNVPAVLSRLSRATPLGAIA